MEKYYYDVRKVSNLREVLNQTVELFPNNIAFKFKKKMNKKGEEPEFNVITYKEFNNEVTYFATVLNSLNLSNDRIALISKNRYEWASVYYAVTTDGKVIVPLDKSLPDNEIISLAQRSEASCIVFEEKYLDVMKKIKEEKLSSIEKFICFDFEEDKEDILSYKKLLKKGKELLESGDKSYSEVEIDNDKMTAMLFTSGTTSISKAVMLSHKNLAENTMSLASMMDYNEHDSILALLPFHHALPSIVNNVVIFVGGCTCFCDGLKYIQQNLCEYKPTIMVSVPLILETLYKRIIKNIEKQGKTKLVNRMLKVTNVLDKLHIKVKRKVFNEIHEALGGKIRIIVSAAAPIDPKLLKDLNDFGFYAVQGYGLTEASPVVSIEGDFAKRRGSVGRAVPNVEIKIDNPDEKGIGEICIKGPNVMLGYYQNNEATEEVLTPDGWFHTGDLGYLENKFLYITGRKKNVIVQKNGKNIFPEELEILISHIPGVKENIVYGRPTNDDDLDVCVKIVYDKDVIKDIMGYVSESEIYSLMKKRIAEINKNMPPYKHIRDIIVTDEELIKNTTAKVKRHEEIAKILGTKSN